MAHGLRGAHEQLGAFQARLKDTGRNVHSATGVVAQLFTEMGKQAKDGVKNVADLEKAFRSLGVSIKDVRAMSADLQRELHLSAKQIEEAAKNAGVRGAGRGAGLAEGLLSGGEGLNTLLRGGGAFAGAYLGRELIEKFGQMEESHRRMDLRAEFIRERPNRFTPEQELETPWQMRGMGWQPEWMRRNEQLVTRQMQGFSRTVWSIMPDFLGGDRAREAEKDLERGRFEEENQRAYQERLARDRERRTAEWELRSESSDRQEALDFQRREMRFERQEPSKVLRYAQWATPSIRTRLEGMVPGEQAFAATMPGPAGQSLMISQQRQAEELARNQALRVGGAQVDVERARMMQDRARERFEQAWRERDEIKRQAVGRPDMGGELTKSEELLMRRFDELGRATQDLIHAKQREGAVTRENLEQERNFAIQRRDFAAQMRTREDQRLDDTKTAFGLARPQDRIAFQRAMERLQYARDHAGTEMQARGMLVNGQWRIYPGTGPVLPEDIESVRRFGGTVGENLIREVGQAQADRAGWQDIIGQYGLRGPADTWRDEEERAQATVDSREQAIRQRASNDAKAIGDQFDKFFERFMSEMSVQLDAVLERRLADLQQWARNGMDAPTR